jgi:hypothetical protein
VSQVLDPELGGLKPFCSVRWSSSLEVPDPQHMDIVYQVSYPLHMGIVYKIRQYPNPLHMASQVRNLQK